MKYAEIKISCICVVVFKIYEGNDYDKIYEVKYEELKINSNLIEIYKDMIEYPDFEQDYWSRSAEIIYKFVHDSSRLMQWLTYD